MPTIVRTQKNYTATANSPLHQISQSVQVLKEGERNMGQSHGQVLGAKARSRKSTPPDQDKDSSQNPDKTPSARAKVLPWVHGVQADDYSLPDGMFGPYDSQPATRVNTVHEATPPPPRQQNAHPFAYNAGGALPFSALGGGVNTDMGAAEYIEEQHRQVRPESEVLSRGAGMKYLNQPIPIVGRGSPTGSKESAGMGTFGLDGAPPPLSKSPAHHTTAHSQAETVRGEPIPAARKAKSNITRKPVPTGTPREAEKHLHHPHRDFPFSHAEAAQKQAAAMETARAQALAQLESSPNRADGLHVAPAGAGKGPRQTFQTSTSGPSFGHLLHQDGHPIPARISMQQGPIGGVPMAREVSGIGGGSMFRIPFGVPMGAMLPRPMMAMRTNTGMNMGIGIPSHLTDVAESPESKARRADRSAYVETVEDEQEPTPKTGATNLAKTAGHRSSKSQVQSAAIAESGIHPLRHSVTHNTVPARHSTPPPDVAPTQTTPSLSPDKVPSNTGKSHHRHKSATTQDLDHLSPERMTHAKAASAHAPKKTHSVVSDAQTHGTARPHAGLPTPSVAPTTVSNVKRIVANSKFHDETLCQLLDAARLNLIGPEAKKALSRAARARVIELKDLRDEGELIPVPEMPPLVHSSSPHSNPIDMQSKSKTGHVRSNSTSPWKEKGGKVAKTVEPATPPQWAQEIITRLAAFDARFNELEKNQHREFTQPEAELLSQDIPEADMMQDSQTLLHELQGLGLASAFPGASPFALNPFTSALGYPPNTTPHEPGIHANVHSLSPTEGGRVPGHQDSLTWGSEVELPAPEDSVPPPRAAPTVAPTIHIQAPTESNAAKTATRVPSAHALSHGDARTPRQIHVSIIEEQIIPAEPALPDPRERSLPATPAESIQSHRPSPVPHSSKLPTIDPLSPRKAPTTMTATPRTHALTVKTIVPHAAAPSEKTAAAVTAFTHQPEQDPVTPKVKIHIADSMGAPAVEPMPWDIVTQRLYSWALVWDEDSFIRALENISLGKQVEEMPLTIFTLMTFKRLLRRNMSSIPKKSCDKMLVPPTMSDAINKAVHSKNFTNARQILEELWYPFGFTEPPRVIIALAKHRNESDHWTAHRFDLSNGHLTSYSITHDEEILADGRPFMWWHAIREAWPQYNIPHPDKLRQRVEYIRTQPEEKGDNSLRALSYARNLLLGFRPELQRDVQQLRETIWQEVKRLLQKKRAGRLVVALDSPDHVHEL